MPEWKRPQPKIDMSKLNPQDPEGMLKMTKQGRTLMMFASVSGTLVCVIRGNGAYLKMGVQNSASASKPEKF